MIELLFSFVKRQIQQYGIVLCLFGFGGQHHIGGLQGASEDIFNEARSSARRLCIKGAILKKLHLLASGSA
jgi:hypothetical protein